MRATRQEQIGAIGQNEASANFERIGWGPVPNQYHDTGTDLFIQVRDERGIELGLIVGAQVKSGPSAFAEPRRDGSGELEGWWFRDADRHHVDAWLQHSVPHLIVLHSCDTRASYWQHVTDDTVESTGIGAKVFVPRSHVVDEAARDALLEIAGARRPGVAWEGSVWMAGAQIAPRGRPRHALIVPRLVAPHANAGTADPLGPEQAIALLMQGRMSQLERFAKEHSSVPRMSEAHESDNWAWRFAGALWARIVRSELDPLLRALEDPPTAAARAAVTVAVVSGLIEDGRVAEALRAADAAVARDDVESVDHAWLLVQRARARAEIGRIAEAQDDALRAQGIRLTFAHDATATAIAASAAVLLFNTSSWGGKDLRSLITQADTAASWWRAQTTARGLWAVADRAFAAVSRGVPIQDADGEPGSSHLGAAARMASHAGDHSAWRQLHSGAAKSELLLADRHADPGLVADALTMLRRAGDHKALQQAASHLVDNGPAEGVTTAAARIDLDASSRTTGRADLALLEHAADVLDNETRERMIAWLLNSLHHPSAFAARTSPTYALRAQLIDTLAAVAAGADDAEAAPIVDHILALERCERELERASWAHAVRALPSRAWTGDRAAHARERASQHDGTLRFALLERAAEAGDDDARSILLDEALTGSLGAVAALGDVTTLPPEVVEVQVQSVGERVLATIAKAHSGEQVVGGPDPAHDLALLNAWHPDAAAWEPLFDLLADDVVIADSKRRALRLLTLLAARLSEPVRERLGSLALVLADQIRRRATECSPTVRPYAARQGCSRPRSAHSM